MSALNRRAQLHNKSIIRQSKKGLQNLVLVPKKLFIGAVNASESTLALLMNSD